MTDLNALTVGTVLTASRKIEDDDIDVCARLTGDFGAHHIAGLGGRKMAQGLLTLSAAPVLGADGVHVAALDLRFLAPVYAGEEVTATTEITSRDDAPDGQVSLGVTVVITSAAGEVLRGTGTAVVAR